MNAVLSSANGTMTELVLGPTWEAEAFRQALALKDLPDNWDRPRSVKPTVPAINAALWYIARVAALDLVVLGAPFVAALDNGGVQLEWEHGHRQLEIELMPDGPARFLICDAGEMAEGELGAPSSPDVEALFGWLAATP
jgi:hypothetical protein